jgi:anti-sigma factor RsiW
MPIHPEEDALERYAMGSLPEAQAAEIEVHLLECGECRVRLEEAEEFIAVFRLAAHELQAERKPVIEKIRRMPRLRKIVWVPAAIAAGVVIALFVPEARQADHPPAIVVLEAFRGPESGARMPAEQPATLVMTLPGATDSLHAVQIVDLEGETVTNAVSRPAMEKLSITVPGLPRGVYWVRVFRTDNSGHPVREYRLNSE